MKKTAKKKPGTVKVLARKPKLSKPMPLYEIGPDNKPKATGRKVKLPT